MQFEKTELVYLARPDICGLSDEAPPKFLLYGDVPRSDVPAVELIGQCEDRERTGHGNAPTPQVGIGNQRNAVREPAGKGERVRSVDEQVQHRGVVGPEWSGQRVRVVGNSEARAEDHAFI